MYTGFGFRDCVIGDVDVLKVGSTYHLFHLVLPNHDFIAHAVSEDGIHWTRVKNAFFIGDPDAWDDDMLWTMHVTPDPQKQGSWRMFYTGLSRAERGRVQRVGLARSDDLYNWTKDTSGKYPLSITGDFYEHKLVEDRYWVSFRDPFVFKNGDGKSYMLACGRAKHGPSIRRGCVSVAEEVSPDIFEFRKPLHHPGQYDEMEVPGLIEIGGMHYLIASIREDVKVRYWVADEPLGPFSNFYDNTLMPTGNYAGRPSREGGDRWLLWSFFYRDQVGSASQVLPPPKELDVVEDGRLRMRSFHGFDKLVEREHHLKDLAPMDLLFHRVEADEEIRKGEAWMGNPHGFEAFLFQGEYKNFRLRTKLDIRGRGKCGVVFRIDEEGHGYFISLDMVKGLVQIRAWGKDDSELSRQSFRYKQLQSGHFVSDRKGPWELRLIGYGSYLEFSVNDYVLLTLVDDTFSAGRVGFYCESAEIQLQAPIIEELRDGDEAGYRPIHYA